VIYGVCPDCGIMTKVKHDLDGLPSLLIDCPECGLTYSVRDNHKSITNSHIDYIDKMAGIVLRSMLFGKKHMSACLAIEASVQSEEKDDNEITFIAKKSYDIAEAMLKEKDRRYK